MGIWYKPLLVLPLLNVSVTLPQKRTIMSADLLLKIVDRSNLDEKAWNIFIANSPQCANYAMTWYLDVVSPHWQGIQVFYKNELHAVMPIRVSSKYTIRYVLQPMLCQYGGIFFREIGGKTEKEMALKKKLVRAVVEAIQKKRLRLFTVNFSPEFDYPLPFHWAGYGLRTRYTYWLHNRTDKRALFKNFNERTRTYINKANKSGLVPKQVADIDPLVQLSRKHDSYNIDYQMLSQLWEAMKQQGVGRAIEVRDNNNRLHAGLIYQISGHKQVHLFSAKDPALTNLGGMSLAIWYSIERAGEDIEIHDFEGSMLEPVEHFFRGFGTRPVPYLQITKNDFPKSVKWLMES